MQSIIYARNIESMSVYQQHNFCAVQAKRNGLPVKDRVLDFSGAEIYKAIDKVVFDDEVSSLIVYSKDCIGDYETALFYRIYLERFGKKLIFCK